MKTLVWGDVHNRIGILKKVLANYGDTFEKRIFLGDWFDQFNDNADQAKATALYLMELMEDPRNVFIEGNHDTSYRFANPVAFCSGFEWDKHRFIHSVMQHRHWEKFKLFEYEQGVLCSHAGVHKEVFEHPVTGITIEQLQKDCDKAVDAIRCNIEHPAYACGMSSGGRAFRGGITWLRWFEFDPIEGLNQIVGHTIVTEPEIIYGRKKVSTYQGVKKEKIEKVKVTFSQYMNMPPKPEKICSVNWNIDTNNAHFATIENGEIRIHLTLDYL